MFRLREIIVFVFVSAAVLPLASCQTSSGSLSVQTGGSTDDPAAGYEKIRPGSEEDFIMAVGRRIYFTSGSADLDDVARETLDLQAQWLNSNPRWLVKLQGYADDSRVALSDIALSDKRADAVMQYLASKGVDSRRMWAKGYGTERQVRDCSDLACKAQNRRVVVNLRTEFDEAAPQYRGG
jgi:peptidoglycan-associated lipoprotein